MVTSYEGSRSLSVTQDVEPSLTTPALLIPLLLVLALTSPAAQTANATMSRATRRRAVLWQSQVHPLGAALATEQRRIHTGLRRVAVNSADQTKQGKHEFRREYVTDAVPALSAELKYLVARLLSRV